MSMLGIQATQNSVRRWQYVGPVTAMISTLIGIYVALHGLTARSPIMAALCGALAGCACAAGGTALSVLSSVVYSWLTNRRK